MKGVRPYTISYSSTPNAHQSPALAAAAAAAAAAAVVFFAAAAAEDRGGDRALFPKKEATVT